MVINKRNHSHSYLKHILIYMEKKLLTVWSWSPKCYQHRRNYNKKIWLDLWYLTADSPITSPFPSASHMGKLIRKFRLSFFGAGRKFKPHKRPCQCARNLTQAPSPNHNKSWASLLSLPFQAMFESPSCSPQKAYYVSNKPLHFAGCMMSSVLISKPKVGDPYHL